MTRPHYGEKKDQNHSIVSRVLQDVCHCAAGKRMDGGLYAGYDVMGLDISSMGNQTDWLVWLGDKCSCECAALEVKQPGCENDLTPGELAWAENFPGRWFVVTDVQQVVDALDKMSNALKGKK